MTNIFVKKTWGDVDWDIYLSNLDTLRKRKGLSKGQFNEFLGVWNAYRKRGLAKAGRETVLTICQKLGVTEEWLGTAHGAEHDEVHLPRGLGMGKAVDLLAAVYASKDDLLIRAIYSNLEAFADSAARKAREAEVAERFSQIEAKLKRLTERMAARGIKIEDDKEEGDADQNDTARQSPEKAAPR